LIRFIETARQVKFFFFLIKKACIGNGEDKSSFFSKNVVLHAKQDILRASKVGH
jgi:hypothetical protein